MAQKKVNTRIQNKHDLEVNWLQATNFIPLPGELIVYDVEVDASGTTLALPSGRTTPYTYERFKIGDGINLVKDLPFVPNKTQAIYYIVGNSTTAGTWTGTHSDITEYYDGLTIAYKVNVAGASGLTLNINNLGAVSVIRNSTTAVTTHYGVDSIIILVYSVDSSGTAYWKVADYDSDTRTRSSNKASTKMYIIGATSQSTSGQTTYSNSKVYIGTDNCLYSNGKKVTVDGHTHNVTTANAAPHTHTHNVTVSGTTGANDGTAVTVATGALSSSGSGAAVVTGSSGTATVLTGVKASGTKTVVTGVSGGSGSLDVYSSEDDTEADASADSGRIPYVESISSTGASANGTATVLTGVKASGTDTFLKAISGGSGSLTSDTTATNGIKYVEAISSTGASASGTAKAGSETHTHTYTKPTGVSLGSNTTSTNGIKYIEDVSHTAASLTGTKTFNTDAIKSVTLSASTTSTDGPAYVESVTHTAASLTGTKTFNTDAIKAVTLSASDTSTDGPQYVQSISGGSGSLTSDTSSTNGIKYVEAQGTFSAGTTPVSSASPTNTSTNTGANSGTAVTALTGVKASGTTSAVDASYSAGVLVLTARSTVVTGVAANGTASVAPSGHTHSYDKTTGISLTRGTAPSLGAATTKYLHHSHTGVSATTKYMKATGTAASTATVGISGGSITPVTKYMKATGTAAGTGTVGISGGSISKTTKYFHPSITTASAATEAPSATTSFVTGVTGGTTSATTKYLHHTHTGASANGTASAVTGVASNGTATVLTGVKGGTTTATTKYLHHTHNGASASGTTSAVTGVTSNGTTTAVTGLSTSKLVTASAAPNAHKHSYGSSAALTTGNNSGTAVAAVTSVDESTD